MTDPFVTWNEGIPGIKQSACIPLCLLPPQMQTLERRFAIHWSTGALFLELFPPVPSPDWRVQDQ